MTDSPHIPWLSFLPRPIAMELLDRPLAELPGRPVRFPAATLFVDVSGFTAISEALGVYGRAGVEELTGILNSYFEPMIALIAEYGGSVGAFGGDAMTVLFPAARGDLGGAARRAVACALTMQGRMDRYRAIPTRAGAFSLAARAGLAAGPILCTVVGDPETGLGSVIAGSALDRCAAAEAAAEGGQVAVDAELLPLLGPAEWRDTATPGFVVVERLTEPVPPAPLPPLVGNPGHQSLAAPFLHPAITERLAAGQGRFINEHRAVSVIFAAFEGLDYDNDPEAAARLQSYLSLVMACVARYDGYLNKVDMGDKGSKLLILFGAPVAHGDDAARALRCALELGELGGDERPRTENREPALRLRSPLTGSSATSSPATGSGAGAGQATDPSTALRAGDGRSMGDGGTVGTPHAASGSGGTPHAEFGMGGTPHAASLRGLRIGVTTGRAFCGRVGSGVRQEYTVIGDAVNLAARLMQRAAPGAILADEATRRAAGDAFVWGNGARLQVRGRAAKTAVYPLEGLRVGPAARAQSARYSIPMVGRVAELALAVDRLELALGGAGQLIGLTADAGMGKTRLAAELIALGESRGFSWVRGECLAFVSSSYLVWAEPLRVVLGLDPEAAPAEQAAALTARLNEIDPALAARVPLLGGVLGLPIAENSLTTALDGRLRKDSLEDMTLACLRAASVGPAGPRPLLIVLEDCQWIDPLSLDLLVAAARAIDDLPVAILLAYRPLAPGGDEEAGLPGPLARMGHFTEIALGELPMAEAGELARMRLARLFPATPPEQLVERIIGRAQGNPFYVEEITSLLRDRADDLVTLASAQIELPDSLNSLIISRIDQLDAAAQATLKVASVIGQSFRQSWLWQVDPQLGDSERVRKQLGRLLSLELLALQTESAEADYLFKHILTREVAYESLSLAVRAALHGQVAAYIERAYPDEVERFLDLLAYHYGQSEQQERKRHYLRRAGEAAQKVYANEAAEEYYRRLLPLLDEAERAPVLLRLGDLQLLTGAWAEAETSFLTAYSLVHADDAAAARVELAIAQLEFQRGAYDAALAWNEYARARHSGRGDRKGLMEALRQLGPIFWSKGDYPTALNHLEDARALAEELGEERALAQTLNNIGLVLYNQGDLDAALERFARAEAIAEELGDRRLASIFAGNMGNVFLARDDYEGAFACYDQKLRTAEELGDRLELSIAVANMGNIYENQAAYEAAATCYLAALSLALDLGDRQGVAIALWSLATVAQAQGDDRAAVGYIDRAIALARALDIPYDLCACLHTRAAIESAANPAVARALNAEALELAAAAENRETALRAELLELRLTQTAGELDEQGLAVAAARLLKTFDEEAEQAAIRYALWELTGDAEHRDVAANLYGELAARSLRAEHRRRYEVLGGSGLPPAPAPPPLPALITRAAAAPEGLLAQADGLLRELR